jgi:hypothetical protein
MGAKKIGFDITDVTVPAREIMRGGPGRDGIFALTNPEFVSAAEAKITDDTRVLGVFFNGIAKAYPLRMLTIHEIVSDSIDDQFYAIT